MSNYASIESKQDFENTPEGIQKRWVVELAAAKKAAKKWQDNGKRVTKVYLDERGEEMSSAFRSTKLNLFSANINTLRAMMFGQTPRVDVGRRYDDADDDGARVASELLERVLNADIGKQFSWAIGTALDDRLLVGFGTGKVRYEADFERIEHEPVTEMDEAGEERELVPGYTEEKKTHEAVPVDYVNWRDVLWSPARTWDEVRWFGFRAYMTRDELIERFGEKIGNAVPLQGKNRNQKGGIDHDAWQKAEVWELWCLDEKMVYWCAEGMDVICDAKEDTLQLREFFPCPMPMMANVTSGSYSPRCDYVLAQDQYEQVNELTTRITMLTRAVKVVGVYDKTATGLQRMLTEAAENELIPVDSWAAFAEKGGIKGSVDWLPIEQVATTIGILVTQRSTLIELLFQATGMSDILRGATVAGETATAQSIKAKFASVRVQQLQDDFARFATDLQKLRAEVMVNHFDDETLVKQSNMEFSHDRDHIPAALEVLRSQFAMFRISIKSETLAAQDLASIRQEKAEFIGGLSQFLRAAQPLIDKYPSTAPTLLEMLKWSMTGFKGSSTIEGVLDQAIASLQQNPPPPPQDPNAGKLEGEKLKQQGRIDGEKAKIQMRSQADMQKIQAETQADLVKQQSATKGRITEEAAQFAFDSAAQQRQEATEAVDMIVNRRPSA